jgi:hypothetical protein
MKYGKIIPNLKINNIDANYPVINEREVRGSAGIMFLVGIISFMIILFTKNNTLLYFLVPIFWLEFFLKTVFQPHYSIFGLIAGFIVKKQTPEYVGVIQKRFAWAIGLLLATIMLIFVVFFGVRGVLPISICSLCLFLMWIESSFGICVGCKMYGFLIKKGLIKTPEIKPACAGNVCSIE